LLIMRAILAGQAPRRIGLNGFTDQLAARAGSFVQQHDGPAQPDGLRGRRRDDGGQPTSSLQWLA
jgi:hypothetical protein